MDQKEVKMDLIWIKQVSRFIFVLNPFLNYFIPFIQHLGRGHNFQKAQGLKYKFQGPKLKTT
jgi:hypothetical protein